jgi:hypothetical protein
VNRFQLQSALVDEAYQGKGAIRLFDFYSNNQEEGTANFDTQTVHC